MPRHGLTSRYGNWGDARFRDMALHGMKYAAAYAAAYPEQLLPEVLPADQELSAAPIHIAIVQIDWLDRSEGELPNREIQYPDLKRAAI